MQKNNHYHRKKYYHRAIWLGCDAMRLTNILDSVLAPLDQNELDKWHLDNKNKAAADWTPLPTSRSVAQVCEHTIVAVVGNCLVLPVAQGYRLDPSYKVAAGTSLYDAFYPTGMSQTPLTITLPTRGTFAEAIPGGCNLCEKIEDDRAQDWTVFTTDEPTAINPLDTGSRYQNPGNLQTKDLASPLVNIQNAPAAPDPQGLQALANLLGKPDLFKDMTGLEGTQNLANNAMLANVIAQQARIKAATDAMNALDKMYEKGQITKKQRDEGSAQVAANISSVANPNANPNKPPYPAEQVQNMMLANPAQKGSIKIKDKEGNEVETEWDNGNVVVNNDISFDEKVYNLIARNNIQIDQTVLIGKNKKIKFPYEERENALVVELRLKVTFPERDPSIPELADAISIVQFVKATPHLKINNTGEYVRSNQSMPGPLLLSDDLLYNMAFDGAYHSNTWGTDPNSIVPQDKPYMKTLNALAFRESMSSIRTGTTVTSVQKSMNINWQDRPDGVKMHDKIDFYTFFVATNFQQSGKDAILGMMKWGFSSEGSEMPHKSRMIVRNYGIDDLKFDVSVQKISDLPTILANDITDYLATYFPNYEFLG